MPALVTLSLAVGTVAYLTIEKPILRWASARKRRKDLRGAVVSPAAA